MYKYCSLLLADSTNMQKESKSEIRAQVGKKKNNYHFMAHILNMFSMEKNLSIYFLKAKWINVHKKETN